MDVEATHTECQYLALHGKQPESLKKRKKLAKSKNKEKLIEMATNPMASVQDRTVAGRRLKELGIDPAQVEEKPEEETPEYPFDKGGGYYELSNGKTVRGEDEALAAQRAIDEAQAPEDEETEEITDRSSNYNLDEGVEDLIEATYKDGGMEAVKQFTEGDTRKSVIAIVEGLEEADEEAEA